MMKVAIIGFGKMGRIRFNEIQKRTDIEVVCICEKSGMPSDVPGDIQFYEEWSELPWGELDAVFVAVYNSFIAEIVVAAIGKDVHVFCEKPPGATYEDVLRMEKALKGNPKVILKFGFNHRFHYAIQETKALIDSGRYGKILWARGIYGKAGSLDFNVNWRSKKELAGGGILLDQGIHMADLLLYFMGEFKEVKSYVQNVYWDVPVEDNAFALLQTVDNRVAMLHSTAQQWKHKFQLDLHCEGGYVCVNGILSSTRSYGDEHVVFAKKQLEDEAKAVGRPREEIIYFDTDDSWKLELDEFMKVIDGEVDTFHGSIDDAKRVMSLIENIYSSGSMKPLVRKDLVHAN